MQFRFVTYNIHKGIGGVDRRYRPERIIETLQHYEPDVVFLQEVDDGVRRSQGHCQVDLLGDELGFPHRAWQANVKLRQGHYGNAILSRFPLSDVHDLDLTIPFKKRRQALVAHCKLQHAGHSRTVLLFNLHLGLAGFERTRQIRKLLACEALRHSRHGTAVIAAGDFNDVWGTLGKRMLAPLGFQTTPGPRKTFPAFLPVRPLDWIYFRGGLRMTHCFASRSEVARRASDHLPLVADFELL